MRKSTLYISFLIIGTILCPSVRSQSFEVIKIAKECSESSLKKNLYYLASDEMEGRMMASHGDTLASLFVAGEFKKAGLTAPYHGNYFQSISATRKSTKAYIMFGRKKYKMYDGWMVFPSGDISLKNIPVLFNTFTDLNELSNYINHTDVNGKAITIWQPLMFQAFSGNIDSIETTWKAKGIVALVWFGMGRVKTMTYYKEHDFIPQYKNELLDPIFNPGDDSNGGLPEISILPERMNDLLDANQIKLNADGSFRNSNQKPELLKNELSISVQTKLNEVHAPNVIGVLKDLDTTLPVIVLSAHHDHDGKKGNKIYYGAVDNASGTTVIIELANMLNKAAMRGLKPKRSIVFASFTGEERGELGSSYYVNHPLYSMEKTYGVLNIDMMGRVDTFYSGKRSDSNYAYILVKDSLHNFRKSLYAANDSLHELTLDRYYEDPKYTKRRLEGSDQFPFYIKGVPFIRIDCGFCKDYHQLTDTPDKINYSLLKKQAQLAFLTLWNMANE